MSVVPGTIWKCSLDGLLHRVVGTYGNQVITFSMPSQSPAHGGMTWLGVVDDFFKHFKKVGNECEPPTSS